MPLLPPYKNKLIQSYQKDVYPLVKSFFEWFGSFDIYYQKINGKTVTVADEKFEDIQERLLPIVDLIKKQRNIYKDTKLEEMNSKIIEFSTTIKNFHDIDIVSNNIYCAVQEFRNLWAKQENISILGEGAESITIRAENTVLKLYNKPFSPQEAKIHYYTHKIMCILFPNNFPKVFTSFGTNDLQSSYVTGIIAEKITLFEKDELFTESGLKLNHPINEISDICKDSNNGIPYLMDGVQNYNSDNYKEKDASDFITIQKESNVLLSKNTHNETCEYYVDLLNFKINFEDHNWDWEKVKKFMENYEKYQYSEKAFHIVEKYIKKIHEMENNTHTH